MKAHTHTHTHTHTQAQRHERWWRSTWAPRTRSAPELKHASALTKPLQLNLTKPLHRQSTTSNGVEPLWQEVHIRRGVRVDYRRCRSARSTGTSSVYLLYWCTSTNTDAARRITVANHVETEHILSSHAGTLTFTCFTSTKVQMLTPFALSADVL